MSAYREPADPEERAERQLVVASVTYRTDELLANLRGASGRASEDFFQRIRFPYVSQKSEVELLETNLQGLEHAIEETEAFVALHASEAPALYPVLFELQALTDDISDALVKWRTLSRLRSR
jgi:hypothetical protein